MSVVTHHEVVVLLECVVCAYKTAEYLKNNVGVVTPTYKLCAPLEGEPKSSISKGGNFQNLKTALQTTMWQNVGIYRNEKSLNQALKDIEQIEKEFNKSELCANIEEYELRNMLITSKLVAKSALQRKESRGAHYRTDYLQTDKVAQHNEIRK